MRKSVIIFAALALLVSCKEFEPVFIGEYPDPAPYTPVKLTPNTTIAALAKTYVHGQPYEITKDIIIGGRVSTNDQPGNVYKSLYIQDETGGIELKIGKNGLYNDYKEGQMIYVDCQGLYLGEYGFKSGNYGGNGMVQLGYDGTGTDYETSYLEVSLLIDTHIFRDDPKDIQKVTPVVMTASDFPGTGATLASCPYLGKLVTFKNLTYTKEAFVLLYINSLKDKKAASNRIFITGTDTKINTLAMSKEKMSSYLESGIWDSFAVGSGGDLSYGKVGDPCYAYQGYYKDEEGKEHWDVDEKGNPIKTYPAIERAAYSVSQYFTTPEGKTVQLRTSGYGKFADTAIDPEVFEGKKTVSITGILTLYQGSVQLTVNRVSDIVID